MKVLQDPQEEMCYTERIMAARIKKKKSMLWHRTVSIRGFLIGDHQVLQEDICLPELRIYIYLYEERLQSQDV